MTKHGQYFTEVCFRQGEGGANKLFHVMLLSKATASLICLVKKKYDITVKLQLIWEKE